MSLAKNVSTALSQEHEVGVKWKVQRGWRPSHAITLGCLWVAVVQDRVHQLAGRDRRLDGVEEAQELLVAVALHAAAHDRPVEHVEGREEGRGAVALVVVGRGRRPTSFVGSRACGRARPRA